MAYEKFKILRSPGKWNFVFTSIDQGSNKKSGAKFQKWLKNHVDSHFHIEILVGVEGNSEYSVDGKLFNVEPGTILIIESEHPHQAGYPKFYPDVTHIWISVFYKKVFARLARVVNGAMMRDFDEALFIYPHECGITDEFNNYESDSSELSESVRQLQVRGIVSHILALFLRRVASDNKTKTVETREIVIHRIQQYIEANVGKDMSLDLLERIFGYSKFHLLRIFKKHAGMTVQEWIDTCRIEYTKQALKDGTSKKKISMDLGFSCPAAFSRWYARHKHKLPA
ncbi:MAG: helix-turn-helix domain-containing protein [Planctomycetota bacterium]|jgi:AraC-like DNA-binding protein